ncbi:MAG: hypothetical protein DMG26_09770, partial [Acidobacteria bacterium]
MLGDPVCTDGAGGYDACGGDFTTPVMVQTMGGATVPALDNMLFNPATGDLAHGTGTGRQVFSVASTDPRCDKTSNPNCVNIIPTNLLDPVVQNILALEPDPNVAGRTNRTSNYFVSAPFLFDRHQVDTKINYNATSKLNLIGTFGVL